MLFSASTFIPATRSFFANLQKNIFTFLASNLDIDPYLRDFGQLYEQSKRFYKSGLFRHSKLKKKDNTNLRNRLENHLKLVIAGDYEYNDEQDWIVAKGKKINLANASSGQQESLPMLLTLCVWPMLRNTGFEMFFIEEPEAHLFPTSQGNIVSILTLLSKTVDTNFFLTTHSPYILSAINNFILADNIVNKQKKLSLDEFIDINGSGLPIAFNDISAYTIDNGVLQSIKDKEFEMVGGEILDSVSEHYQDVMNKLLIAGEK